MLIYCDCVTEIAGNELEWNSNKNKNNRENVFENVICLVVAIFSQPQCIVILQKGTVAAIRLEGNIAFLL